ncbi:MAG: serine/threonine-protein kinase [Acidobacteria bacterium]|nr:serine/threonine-protein kinase [Acidobacteriota bacterium]
MLLQGQTLGKYQIVAPLGSGGFGAVYLARDTWIDKHVALKVPHRQNLNFSELLHEPRLLATLDHPNIVSITTAEKQENIFFIVMEYVEGETLETVIAGGALDMQQTLDLSSQACSAIRHAHDHGVIHRDLRPPNMLLSRAGVLKIADFGVSRFLELAARGTTVIGSPPYMAPEQFEGKAVFASDIYSLGVTMYQMLTGVLPYESPTPSDLERLMREDLVQPPRHRNPSIPVALNDIVMKAMAPDLANRYPHAQDLLDELLAASGTADSPAVAAPAQPVAQQAAQPVRDTPQVASRAPATSPFCWHCHKPLHARAGRCPFCGEAQ